MSLNRIYIDPASEAPDLLKNIVIPAFNDALEFSDPYDLVQKILFESGNRYNSLTIFAFGKTSGLMAKGLIDFYKNQIESMDGVLSSNVIPDGISNLSIYQGGHPIVNQQSLLAGQRALEIANGLSKNDNVICLISGGGSALFDSLVNGITLDVQQNITHELLKLGLEDAEINIFRKLFSSIKGGKLAKKISPAKIWNIIISDDVINDIEAIASGPTVASSLTKKKIDKIVKKWKLPTILTPNTWQYVNKAIGDFKEQLENYLDIQTDVIFDNKLFLLQLKENLESAHQFSKVEIFDNIFHKSAKKCAIKLSNYIQEYVNQNKDKSFCILAGGEIPITVKPNGKGGRNQHFSLMLGKYLDNIDHPWFFSSIATDGYDYLRGISGGFISSEILHHASCLNICMEEYISNTNTYYWHDQLNTHFYCDKPTGMNVSDIYIFVYDGRYNE